MGQVCIKTVAVMKLKNSGSTAKRTLNVFNKILFICLFHSYIIWLIDPVATSFKK